jgi:hypothetical protein
MDPIVLIVIGAIVLVLLFFVISGIRVVFKYYCGVFGRKPSHGLKKKIAERRVGKASK